MKGRKHKPEQIILKLREADARLKRAIGELTLDKQILKETNDFLSRGSRW